MCKRLETPIYPGLRRELEKRTGRRMTKVAQLYAHASRQISNLQDSLDLAEAACDAVVQALPRSLAFHRNKIGKQRRLVNSNRTLCDQSGSI
jgi:hypothetical protein